MSDATDDRTALEEIMTAAENEIKHLRSVIANAQSASQRLDDIGDRIDGGIEKTVELSESSQELNSRLQELANAIQELNPESLEGLIRSLLHESTDRVQEMQKETTAEIRSQELQLTRLRNMVLVSIALSGITFASVLSMILLG